MKTNFRQYLKVGHIELEKFQQILTSATLLVVDKFVHSYGFCLTQLGKSLYSNEWYATKLDSHTIKVNAGSAIIKGADDLPHLITLNTDTNYTIPSVSGTYKLLLGYGNTSYEIGAVTLTNNSQNVVGRNTKFTEVFATNRRLIVNNTAYLVLSVTDDTNLSLQEVYTGSTVTEQNFSVGGWFINFPSGINDNLNYTYDTALIRVTNGIPTDYEIEIAEIVVSGGAITTVTDKRANNTFQLISNLVTISGQDIPARTYRFILNVPTGGVEYVITEKYVYGWATKPDVTVLHEGQAEDGSGNILTLYSPDFDNNMEIRINRSDVHYSYDKATKILTFNFDSVADGGINFNTETNSVMISILGY
jgi:hypothetical protein